LRIGLAENGAATVVPRKRPLTKGNVQLGNGGAKHGGEDRVNDGRQVSHFTGSHESIRNGEKRGRKCGGDKGKKPAAIRSGGGKNLRKEEGTGQGTKESSQPHGRGRSIRCPQTGTMVGPGETSVIGG